MQILKRCKRCHGKMTLLDVLMEGYDLICSRCGERVIIDHRLLEPPPCFQ